MSANQFAPLAFGHPGGQQNSRSNRTGRARSGGIVGGALRGAGLVDEDSGMRDVSSTGPRRAGRGPEIGRIGNPLSLGTSQARLGEGPSQNRQSGQGNNRARDRANPMAGRDTRPRATYDPSVSGQAFGIRGAAAGRGQANGSGPVPVAELLRNGHAAKGKGRIPGGGGHDNLGNNRNPVQATTGRTIAVLKKFLSSRWNKEAQFLNLEAMATDRILLEEGLKPPGIAGAHKDLGTVMWKLCKEMFPNVTTISLAKNDFKTLYPVATLAEFLPGLRNLSLEGNDIKWAKDLSFHASKTRASGSKFTALQELILNGNPVHDNAVAAGNQEGYRAEVLARFPHLTMLDRVVVSQTETNFANLPGSSKSKDSTGVARGAASAGVDVREFPLAVGNRGFADQEANTIIPPFLSKYFEMFDSNRDSLRAVYSPDATFSVVTSSGIPPRARSTGYFNSMPRQKDLNWKTYKDIYSHNIMTLGARPASKGFPRGPGSILATINNFPKTTHPLSDASKFVVDGWVINNAVVGANLGSSDKNTPPTKPDALLFITVQGEFAEHPSLGVRSFSRCFVVAPTPPGSPAANLGWPCVIISDQLTVRQYAGNNAWNVDGIAPATTTPANLDSTTNTQSGSNASLNANTLPNHLKNIPRAQGLTEQQHMLSLRLAAQTNLTYPFAVQCLSENDWNPSQALSNFQTLKATGTIPAEAFAM